MDEPRKRPGWKAWTAVALAAAALYVLSGAPAEILLMKIGAPEWLVVPGRIFYAPLVWLLDHAPEQIAGWYRDAYGGLCFKILGGP